MDYLYVNGAIKAKDALFLTESQFHILKQTPRKFFSKVLCDFNYGYFNTNDLEAILKQENEKTLKELTHWLTEDHYLLKCYKLHYDLVNIKHIYKKLYFGVYTNTSFEEFGNYSAIALEKAIAHANYSLVSDDALLFTLLNKIPKDNPFIFINQVSKIFYDYMLNKYIKRDKTFKKYYQIKITCENIVNIMRCKKLKLSRDLVSNLLIENSYIDNKELMDIIYDKEELKILNYRLPIYFDGVFKNDKLTTEYLNKELNRVIINMLKSLEYAKESSATLLIYLNKKEEEIKKIRKLYYNQDITGYNLSKREK